MCVCVCVCGSHTLASCLHTLESLSVQGVLMNRRWQRAECSPLPTKSGPKGEWLLQARGFLFFL